MFTVGVAVSIGSLFGKSGHCGVPNMRWEQVGIEKKGLEHGSEIPWGNISGGRAEGEDAR